MPVSVAVLPKRRTASGFNRWRIRPGPLSGYNAGIVIKNYAPDHDRCPIIGTALQADEISVWIEAPFGGGVDVF
jgi:hypothetical protein